MLLKSWVPDLSDLEAHVGLAGADPDLPNHHVSDGGHHVGDVLFEAVLVIFLSIIFVFVSYWHCIFPMDGECAWNSLQLRASSCGFLACHALTQLYLNAPHTPRDCHHHHHYINYIKEFHAKHSKT